MIDTNLLKHMDLKNDIGLSSYKGMAAQQNHNAFAVFHQFMQEEKPARILEIGTALGGFTDFLFNCIHELKINSQIKSYDINYNPWYKDLQSKGIDIIVKNIFDYNYQNLIDDTVVTFIKEPGLTVVLCDGGCKKCEYKILSQYLKTNDIIMTHDYAPNNEYFQTNMYKTIWNWHEIQDSDIQEYMTQYNITKYRYEEFLSVAWLCSKKL